MVDVFTPFQSLLSAVESDIKRAERDNDLIYHHVPPSLASLQPILPAPMVKSDVTSSLTDPQSVIQREAVILGELLAWGARKAIGPCPRTSAKTLLINTFSQMFILIERITSSLMKSLRTRVS